MTPLQKYELVLKEWQGISLCLIFFLLSYVVYLMNKTTSSDNFTVNLILNSFIISPPYIINKQGEIRVSIVV